MAGSSRAGTPTGTCLSRIKKATEKRPSGVPTLVGKEIAELSFESNGQKDRFGSAGRAVSSKGRKPCLPTQVEEVGPGFVAVLNLRF